MQQILKFVGNQWNLLLKWSDIISAKRNTFQSTLFENKSESYIGLNAWGEPIEIPNFQPLVHDDNPRLDMENIKNKRKRRK